MKSNVRLVSALFLAALCACNSNLSSSATPSDDTLTGTVHPVPTPATIDKRVDTNAPGNDTGPPTSDTAPAPATHAVLLNIAARDHAPERPPAGWCAETSIQEALLYLGAFVPQRAINRAGKPSHPDLYWSDVPRAMKRLGLSFRRWSGTQTQSDFIAWVEDQIDRGNPVIAGVKLHPTEHPKWGLDHIVLIVGYDDDALFINTTWGYRERRTHNALASTDKGISFNNAYGRYYAYAIYGWKKSRSSPIALSVEDETGGRIRAQLSANELIVGHAYQLTRQSLDGKHSVGVREFTASATRHRFPIEIDTANAAKFTVTPKRTP